MVKQKRYQNLKSPKEIYTEISRISGFSLDEIVSHCLVLVIDRESKYFGRVGILVNSLIKDTYEIYLVDFMKGKRHKREEFKFRGNWTSDGEDYDKKLFRSLNPYALLEEYNNLFMLFDVRNLPHS